VSNDRLTNTTMFSTLHRSALATVTRRPVVAFVGLAYALSWAAWGLGYGAFEGVGAVGTDCFLLGGLGPFVAAAVVARVTGTVDAFRARLFRWRVAPRWYPIALGGPFTLALAVVAVEGLLWDGRVTVDALHPIATIPGFVVGGVLLGGLEEPGWRGFAQVRLERRYGTLAASLVVAVAWVGWHLPLFVLPGTAQSDVPLLPFAAMGLFLAVVFALAFEGAGRSVIVVALLHGGYNGALGWSALLEGSGTGHSLWLLVLGLVVVTVALVAGSGPATRGNRSPHPRNPRP
jgi:membrane protease YdiL (CAAX protease family)